MLLEHTHSASSSITSAFMALRPIPLMLRIALFLGKPDMAGPCLELAGKAWQGHTAEKEFS